MAAPAQGGSAGHGQAAEGHGGEGGHGAMPTGWDGCVHVWGQTPFVASVVNFGVLLAVLVAIGRKPLLNYLKERRVAVEEGLTEAERMKKEAQAKYDEYTSRLEQLDKELEQLRHEMIKAGEAERDRIVAEAEEKAARMRRDTEFVIEQQMKQLREDLKREAVEAAIQSATETLRNKATSADQERLAQQYLESLRQEADGGSHKPRKTQAVQARQEGAA
jgi:F-type H+-transporting ATPase subunit b